jgi:hypothetical protein
MFSITGESNMPFSLIQAAFGIFWLGCVVVSVLKNKIWSAVVGVISALAIAAGWTIGGWYLFNPLAWVPVFAAVRLGSPKSYWAYWFYRKRPNKYMRALQKYNMTHEYLELQHLPENERKENSRTTIAAHSSIDDGSTPVYGAIMDACWTSNTARQEAILPLIAAYRDCAAWPQDRLKKTVQTIAMLTVNRIIAEINYPEELRNECRNATDLTAALKAAQEVASVPFLSESQRAFAGNYRAYLAAQNAADRAGWSAAEAAWGTKRATQVAHEAASAAAHAADASALSNRNPDDVLRTACQLWLDASAIAAGPK